MFDEQFKYVSSNSGFEQVGNDQEFKTHLFNAKPIDKSGYLYVYVSNETPNIDVFFDNLQVTHVRGALLEETHYYPFGLIQQGISSKAFEAPANTYQYQGSYSTFEDETGYNDFQLRNYDAQIGRWIQPDPYDEYPSGYSGMGDNPVSNVDPDGGCVWCETAEKTLTLKEVVVTAIRKAPKVAEQSFSQPSSSYQWYQFFNDHNPGGDFLYELNKWNPVANLFNGIKTYATGSDFYDVKQSNETATVQLISVIPIGRVASTIENVSLAAVRQGIAKTLATPNDLIHIFKSKHNLNLLLSKAGSEANIVRKLYLSLGQSGQLPANGNFNIAVNIYGQNVTINGAMVNGIPRIGTAFIP